MRRGGAVAVLIATVAALVSVSTPAQARDQYIMYGPTRPTNGTNFNPDIQALMKECTSRDYQVTNSGVVPYDGGSRAYIWCASKRG
ncbi:hypothetical protein [Streptomyces phaeolivaceus]|nr:hypothetical protein [Streptomyces phaeolivaceus]